MKIVNGQHKKGDKVTFTSPDGTVCTGTVIFVHDDGVLKVKRDGGPEVLVKASQVQNSFANGRLKATNEINNKLMNAGIKVENEHLDYSAYWRQVDSI